MSHTYTNLLSHVVFSTKERRPLIDIELKPRLLEYMNGIAKENGAKVLSLNAEPDHVHLLWDLPPTSAMSDALRVLKTNSSGGSARLLVNASHSGGKQVTAHSASAAQMCPWSQNILKRRKVIIGGERLMKNSWSYWLSTALNTIRNTSLGDLSPLRG